VIEAVVVDLGGVAADFRPERRLQALAALSGLAEATISDPIFGSGLEEQAEMGAFTREQAFAAVRNALDDRVEAPDLTEAWSKAFELRADVLERVAALPVRAVLFTNNGPMLDACLDGPLRALSEAFHEIVCSWHLSARKPDAAAFERAAARLRLAPHGLLLLDDSEANVDAAIRCGWSAERVASPDNFEAALAKYAELRP
jgi:HAD superfamily hydrolase (TIGR01509 family)